MTDNLVVSFKDSSIYESDVNILKNSNQWLNDSIISFKIEFLKDKLLEKNENKQLEKEILLLSPSIIFLCSFVDSEQEVLAILSQLKLESRELIFIPLNNNRNPEIIGGGSHWSLMVFVKKLNQFLYYDSMNRSNSQDALFVISKFKFLLTNSNKNLKEYINFQATPQQINSHDCGLYGLGMMEELLNIIIDKKEKHPDLDYSDILLSPSTKEIIFNIITPNYIKDKRTEILNQVYSLKK
ncbi:hypothetical protein DICPUDRAFT_87334 [Dictyostelium purpureum]|uniref:Ubiquitin-like protease family profile domain-containing protein n=1 Tax=Dictyostelium purpureum TaxID=5786 RepID=F0ZHF2_DICPU|nr:uncharacterized protein DICPUDRAFT_87334 [Dictyostelium purpureum]EGC36604.1 hypothetical protein DICPUDRAFT_87334 [Dictyostelium purpureum]|eukprot:XP_003286842.1 hypothetical protein DICPUDRAFT_87334 [Dictyostelium purpureum]